MSAAEGFEEFVVIVESGSLTAASKSLGLPRPTLSRRLAKLEERLGARLLHRTTRRMKLTPQGEALYAKARHLVRSAREAEAEVRLLDGVPRGLLRVSIPARMPEGLFTKWMIEFLDLCPEVTLEIVGSNVHVDLVAEGFDVAIRAGDIEDPSLVVRTVAQDARVAVASARYLAEHGIPQRPEDLAAHNCIVGFRAGSVPVKQWPLNDGGWAPVSGTLKTNQMPIRLEAALQDYGIALVIDRMAARYLADGSLVAVLPGVVGRRERFSLVYPNRRLLDPKVRAFIDFVAESLTAARERRVLTD